MPWRIVAGMPYVEVFRSGRKEREVSVEGFEATVGRDPTARLRLDDAAVSRLHARLYTKDGIWMIEDLQTSNGTFVNGAREFSCAVHDGDRIQVADWVLVFRRPPGELAPTTPPKFVSRRNFAQSLASAKGVAWEPLREVADEDSATRIERLSDVLQRAHPPEGSTRVVSARDLAKTRQEAMSRLGPHPEHDGKPIPLDRERLVIGGARSKADVKLASARGFGSVVLERYDGALTARARVRHLEEEQPGVPVLPGDRLASGRSLSGERGAQRHAVVGQDDEPSDLDASVSRGGHHDRTGGVHRVHE